MKQTNQETPLFELMDVEFHLKNFYPKQINANLTYQTSWGMNFEKYYIQYVVCCRALTIYLVFLQAVSF